MGVEIGAVHINIAVAVAFVFPLVVPVKAVNLVPGVALISYKGIIYAVGKDLGNLRKVKVFESIKEEGIRCLVNAKCQEIKEGAVVLEQERKQIEEPCDFVVIAVGTMPKDYKAIQSYCEKTGCEYHIVGDAKKTRKAIDAIAEAAELARAI